MNTAPSAPLALDRKGVAKATSLSVRRIDELVKAKEIPHVRHGRRVIFPVQQIQRWLASRVVKAPRRAGV